MLVCPACQASVPDWTAELDRCGGCLSTHLIRRLGQIECLDCRWTRDPASASASASASAGTGLAVASAAGATETGSRDPTLADEVSRALDRVLGRH